MGHLKLNQAEQHVDMCSLASDFSFESLCDAGE